MDIDSTKAPRTYATWKKADDAQEFAQLIVELSVQLEVELNVATVNEVFAENKAYKLEKELKQAQDCIKRLEQLAEIRLAYLQLLEKNVDILKPRIKQLEQALESITKQVPTHDGGGFFCLRFDGEGNEIGVEYIDPMTIVSKIYSIAIEAIETKEAKL